MEEQIWQKHLRVGFLEVVEGNSLEEHHFVEEIHEEVLVVEGNLLEDLAVEETHEEVPVVDFLQEEVEIQIPN